MSGKTQQAEHSDLTNSARYLLRRMTPAALAASALILCACSDSDTSAGANTPGTTQTPQTPGNTQTPDLFEDLFSLEDIKTIRIQISEKEWNGLLHDFDRNARNEVYRRADFLFGADPDSAERVNDVAFRLRGNSFSRARPEQGRGAHNPSASLVRVHFKIKFNERFNEDESAYGGVSADIDEIPANRGRLFRGVRSLNLKHNRIDESYLREVFAHDLFHRLGLPAARWAFTRLYIQIGNGPERYMGVYQMGEALDSYWVRRHYDNNSFLFKCLYQQFGPANLASLDNRAGPGTGPIGIEITDPAFRGESWSEYRPSYDLKHDDDEFSQAEENLNNLIRFLMRSSTQEQFAQRVDVATLLKAQAISAFVGHWDGYWRNANNYYLLQDASNSKWVYVLYDFDLTFTDDFIGSGSDNLATTPFMNWGDIPFMEPKDPVLMERALAFDAYQRMYLDFIRELIDEENGVLNPSNAETRLKQLQAVIMPHISGYQAEQQASFSSDLSEIFSFIRTRAQTARTELAAIDLERRQQGRRSLSTPRPLPAGP